MCARMLRGRRESGSIPVVLAGVVVVFASCIGRAEAANATKSKAVNRVAVGLDWFTHQWKPKDKVARGGDGLGPMFNARSCAECHSQGVVGGGGGVERNVQIFAVQLVNFRGGKNEAALVKQVLKLHPGLKEQPAVVMHRFGVPNNYAHWRNERIRKIPFENVRAPSMLLATAAEGRTEGSGVEMAILSGTLGQRADTASDLFRQQVGRFANRGTAKLDPINIRLTERNTTALFGAGMIDRIPEHVIKEQVRQEQPMKELDEPQVNKWGDRRPEIVGKVALLPDGRVGKFGWKAQHATLAEFSEAACAVEVGLHVPGHEQGGNPLYPSYVPPAYDMTRRDVEHLVAFVSSLPTPRQVVPDDVKAETLSHGEILFDRIGCTDCHVKKLGGVNGIYSDLLVHNMGGSFGDVGYYNMFVSDFAKNGANRPRPDPDKQVAATEWRTPPLWGVGDSAPYMHDGRAETLEEAVLAHEGTALWSSREFQGLKDEERTAVISFLSSLRAPSLRQITTAVVRAEPSGS